MADWCKPTLVCATLHRFGGRLYFSYLKVRRRAASSPVTYHTCIRTHSINYTYCIARSTASNRLRAAADTQLQGPLPNCAPLLNQTRRSCPARGAGISFLSYLSKSACLCGLDSFADNLHTGLYSIALLLSKLPAANSRCPFEGRC